MRSARPGAVRSLAMRAVAAAALVLLSAGPALGESKDKQTAPPLEFCAYDVECDRDEVCDDDGYCTPTCSTDDHCPSDWTCSKAGRCDPVSCEGCLGGVRVDDIKAQARDQLACQGGVPLGGGGQWLFVVVAMVGAGLLRARRWRCDA